MLRTRLAAQRLQCAAQCSRWSVSLVPRSDECSPDAARFALGLSGFLLLTVWTLPPWIVVALLVAAGLLFGLV